MAKFTEFLAGPGDAGRRLDRVLRRFLPEAGLPEIYRAIRLGAVRLDGSKARPSARVEESSRIAIGERLLAQAGNRTRSDDSATLGRRTGPSSTDALVILETANLVFFSKPRGMLTHGDGGLDAIVRRRYAAETSGSLSFSPGPLHRLDRNTSGIIACSRTLDGARIFSEMLREGKIRKTYLALMRGGMENEEEWRDILERDRERKVSTVGDSTSATRSKLALTVARPILRGSETTLALMTIATGRTHQIRAQAAAHGHPLVGDGKYGGGFSDSGYILHAWRLEFEIPPFPDVPERVVAPLPDIVLDALAARFGRGEIENVSRLGTGSDC